MGTREPHTPHPADGAEKDRAIRRLQWTLVVVLLVLVTVQSVYLIVSRSRLRAEAMVSEPWIPDTPPPIILDPSEVREDVEFAQQPRNDFGDGLFVQPGGGRTVGVADDTHRDAVMARLDTFIAEEGIDAARASDLRALISHSERMLRSFPARQSAGEIGVAAREDLHHLELQRRHLEVENLLGTALAESLAVELEAAREAAALQPTGVSSD